MEFSPGMLFADRFVLEAQIGTRKGGLVFRARDARLGRVCALKVVEAQKSDPKAVEAFNREAQIIARLSSPHLPALYEWGGWGSLTFVAMELLEGESLARRLGREPKLTPREVVRVLEQVAQALSTAHEAGLVHRSVRPANIFLVRGDLGQVKLLGFGSARDAASASATDVGVNTANAFYMSPEQAKGESSLDPRTDLWALAVVAFECLAGRRPFDGHFGQIFAGILSSPLPVPSQLAPQLPRAVDAWWQKAAARPREQRFQEARQMIRELDAALLAPVEPSSPAAPAGRPKPMLAATDLGNLPDFKARGADDALSKGGDPVVTPVKPLPVWPLAVGLLLALSALVVYLVATRQ